MREANSQSAQHDKLKDIVYIQLPPHFSASVGSFAFDSTKELPVQLAENQSEIDVANGIRIEAIAAAIIKILAYYPTHPEIAYYRTLLLALQEDAEKELLLAAIAKAKVEEYDFAEELFLAIAHLNPTHAESFVNLSVLYAEQAQKAKQDDNEELYDSFITQQVEILKSGLDYNPRSELLLSEAGLLQLFLGNDEIALGYLKEYLSVATDSDKRELIASTVTELEENLEDDQTFQAAFDEMLLGNVEQALRLIETFLERQKKAWEGYFIKGWALRVAMRFEEASHAFVRALELGGQSADIYNELSLCHAALGEVELAQEYLEIATDLEPNNLKLLSNLAFLHLKNENYSLVHELYLRALELDSEDPLVKQLGKELASRDELPLEDELDE